ncbi:MAG: hypothetical protein DRO01_00645 [Thermoproteota archaeon]|nr:MAG: hypothetical protein DRO01_00645 [Candidatus Korarchaeota archaeon]
MAAGEKAILFTPDSCIGCRACQVACHVWNSTRPEVTDFSPTFTNPPDLLPNVWTVMEYKEVGEGDSFDWLFFKRQCMHCSNAPCAEACPAGAIEVHPEGAVVIRQDKCIGCRYCVEACPYDVPRYDPITNKVYKCTMCIDRLQNGLEPACVSACPTDALVFGDYDELVSKYRAAGYEIYGDSVNDYVGRTHYVYATKRWAGKLTDPTYFGDHLLKDPRKPAVSFTRSVVRPVGWALTGLTLVGLLGHLALWRSKRMEEVKKGGE